jgi:mannose-6-phosphate isomerase-like protein (cupin superfamily)
MERKLLVSLDEAVTGVLHGGGGTFRILIDRETSNAEQLSLLLNTMRAGVRGSEHAHPGSEHCLYILSGTGTAIVGDARYEIGPRMALFVPMNARHRIEAGPAEDLTYLVVYAPPGPEQQLRRRGETAFDEPQKAGAGLPAEPEAG